jgi:hypothetical protein
MDFIEEEGDGDSCCEQQEVPPIAGATPKRAKVFYPLSITMFFMSSH